VQDHFEPARVLAEQRERLGRVAAALETQLDGVPAAGADAAYRRAVLALRLAQTRAAIGWLERDATAI